MERIIRNLLLVGVIVTSVMIISCNKDEDNTESPQDEETSGIFTDSRDGKTYKWKKIGSQVWMAENLNFESELLNWVYDDDTMNAEIYGRLYTWYTACEVCPDGWHLPTEEEWNLLAGTVDSQFSIGDDEWTIFGFRGYDVGKQLKSTSGWISDGNGLDSFGFSALPGGVRNPTTGVYSGLGELTYYWSKTTDSDEDPWTRGLYSDHTKWNRVPTSAHIGISVRCLKD